MAIRCVLFDNDGTLVDTHDLILDSMRYATREVLGRVIPDDELMAKVGIPLADQMMDFSATQEERDTLLRVYREYNHARHDAAIRLFPGVKEGVQRLSSFGLVLGVVTSKRAPLATRGLQITDVWPYMRCLVGADDCPKGKPAPDPIIMAASMLDVQPEECVYVGDSPFDIHAGNAAGCITAAAAWGMFDLDQLLDESPDRVFRSFAELTQWLIS